MKQKVNYGIFSGAIVGLGLTTVLFTLIVLFVVFNSSSLPRGDSIPISSSAMILGVITGAIVGVIFGTVIGAISGMILIYLVINSQAKKFDVSKEEFVKQWEFRRFTILGAIGGGLGILILIICPFIYTIY